MVQMIDNLKVKISSLFFFIRIMFKGFVLMFDSIFLLLEYYLLKVWFCIFTPKGVTYFEDIPKINTISRKIINKTIEIIIFKNDMPNIWKSRKR